MICPVCQQSIPNEAVFCPDCGFRLTRPAKKGRHWVPILIMVLLSALGTGLFFALPYGQNIAGYPFVTDEKTPWFQIENGALYFDGACYDGNNELTVPASISGQQVLMLSEGCFENCTELTAVYLPDSLQAIGADAFRGCTSLRGMDIPESVQIIGERAFASCPSLEAVSIHENIQAIGKHAFSDCHKLHFIFFSGNYENWLSLYDGFITSDTAVFCQDGSYYHGE